MAALKTLVIGMGLLIVAGMGLIAWGLYEKVADPGFKLFAGDGETVGATESAPSGRRSDATLGAGPASSSARAARGPGRTSRRTGA